MKEVCHCLCSVVKLTTTLFLIKRKKKQHCSEYPPALPTHSNSLSSARELCSRQQLKPIAPQSNHSRIAVLPCGHEGKSIHRIPRTADEMIQIFSYQAFRHYFVLDHPKRDDWNIVIPKTTMSIRICKRITSMEQDGLAIYFRIVRVL